MDAEIAFLLEHVHRDDGFVVVASALARMYPPLLSRTDPAAATGN